MITPSPAQYDKVDPAALLIAVLAVAVAPLTTEGNWTPLSTIIALIIGAIVFCFTWPHHSPRRLQDRWITTAQSLTFGLIATVVAAWPMQSIVVLAKGYSLGDCVAIFSADCSKAIVEAHLDLAGTYLGMMVGAIVGFVFWILIRRRTS